MRRFNVGIVPFWSALMMRWVAVLFKMDSNLTICSSLVEPVLCRPALFRTCLFLQAFLGSPCSPAALLHPGLCRIAGLLGVFLREVPPRQSAEGRRPRSPPLSHSLPREGRHRWRYGAAAQRKRPNLLPFINKNLITLLLSARKLSLVGELPGANVKSYAGYLTVNQKYNSNLFFWFFPALKVGSTPPLPQRSCVFTWRKCWVRRFCGCFYRATGFGSKEIPSASGW